MSKYIWVLALICFIVAVVEAIRGNGAAVAFALPMTVLFAVIGRLMSPASIAKARQARR